MLGGQIPKYKPRNYTLSPARTLKAAALLDEHHPEVGADFCLLLGSLTEISHGLLSHGEAILLDDVPTGSFANCIGRRTKKPISYVL